MSIIISDSLKQVREEAYAAVIHIRSNPVDMLAGSVQLEMQTLEYHNDDFVRMYPATPLGETVGDFVQRTFTVGGKEITGAEVADVIKQYTVMLHSEAQAE